jgi:hypothetical protein
MVIFGKKKLSLFWQFKKKRESETEFSFLKISFAKG